MPTCFVIQPFDADKFDRRFAEVYAPAIKATGLEPYRVDQDPAVAVPIDAIESGIRSATVCLADITTDNPNVWYELGFAVAAGRPVVMVCSDERTGKKYPFDIQHRTVIPYKAGSPSDFTALQAEITSRIKARISQKEAFRAIEASEQVALVHGLSQPELAVLAAIVGNIILPTEGVPSWTAKRDVESAGFTPVGFTFGVQRLCSKALIELREAEDERGNPYQEIAITTEGWNWVDRNESQFLLKRPDSNITPAVDDVPF